MKINILFVLICLLFGKTLAQQKKNDLPGNPALVSSNEELLNLASQEKENFKYSVEDYFKDPAQSEFRLSQNGQYLSYLEKKPNGKRDLRIKNIVTNEVKSIVEEKEQKISRYEWVSDNQIVYLQDNKGDENYHLYMLNVDGTDNVDLTPFANVQVKFNEIVISIRSKGAIIVEMNKDNPEVYEPYMIDLKTGVLVKLFENLDKNNPISRFYFDKEGNLKAYTTRHNGTESILYYCSDKSKGFEKINEATWKDDFLILDFNYASSNPDDAYVITNLSSNTDEIVLYDFKQKKILKKLFFNENYDLMSLETSKKRNFEIDYYSFYGQKQTIVPVSATYKKLDAKFKKEFIGFTFSIIDRNYQENKYLLSVKSDKSYGRFFLYDLEQDKFKELINLAPQLKEDDMAEVRPIKFISRDGLSIEGYITIPNGASQFKVPLIVNPHGGPYGQRDSWMFNPETQLFASRGYATIQINYRGSGGYGKKLYLAGSKQIGRNMLNDLEDGVKYAKSLGFIKEDKIAIYGGSYGGLATLGSLVKTPDLYTCGISYVGVSNLFTFVESFPPYWKPLMKQFYEQWYDSENPLEAKIMKEVSPALNADKITKPLFIVQGANDPRVNINESDQIVSNLRKKGFKVPYMVKYNEGHGFKHEENKIELYKCMMGYFAEYLK